MALDQPLGEDAQAALARNQLPNPRTVVVVVPIASWRARKENRFQEVTHSTVHFLLFQSGYKGQKLFQYLVLYISCSMFLLAQAVSPLGEGQEREGFLLPPRLRKKQSNNYHSNTRMVLQQVFAAWKKKKKVEQSANLRFSLQVITSSSVDCNSERTPCNVIRQNDNVLNFMFKI